MKQTIRINELPTRTWNRLGVNAAEIEWGKMYFQDFRVK